MRSIFVRVLTIVFALSCADLAHAATFREQLIGTWIYVSSTAKREDGSGIQRPSLQGAVTYTADGHFHFITTATGDMKYASNDPTRPSPDEAMATASSSIAYAGTYSLDESTNTIILNIETSTFPNLVGAPDQRRVVTSVSTDDMTFTNPRNPAGVTLEFVWKRAK